MPYTKPLSRPDNHPACDDCKDWYWGQGESAPCETCEIRIREEKEVK
jgi:hypothetical protein